MDDNRKFNLVLKVQDRASKMDCEADDAVVLEQLRKTEMACAELRKHLTTKTSAEI